MEFQIKNLNFKENIPDFEKKSELKKSNFYHFEYKFTVLCAFTWPRKVF